MEEAGVEQFGAGPKLVINSSYAIMAGLKSAGILKAGAYYRFNYNSIYNQEVTGIVNTGVDEILILLATSENTFSNKAYSVDFPLDDIDYNFGDNKTEDGSTSRPGFIQRRRDTVLCNEAPFDFRTILFRRWAVNTASIPNFIPTGHAYTTNFLIKNSNTVYRCRAAYSSGATFAADFAAGNWITLFTYDETLYLGTSTAWSFQGVTIPVLAGTYQDYTIFNPENGVLCYDVTVEAPCPLVAPSVSRFAGNTVFLDGVNPILNAFIFLSGSCFSNTFYSYGFIDFNFNVNLKGTCSGSLLAVQQGISLDSDGVISSCSLRNNSSLTLKGSNDNATIEHVFGLVKDFSNGLIIGTNTEVSYINVTGSLLFGIAGGEVRNGTNITFVPATLTECFNVYLYDLKNKKFSGTLISVYIRSNDLATKTYTGSYTNIVANKTSNDGLGNTKIWYELTDNTGVTTNIELT